MVVKNSGDTYIRGGRNVKKVKDEYVYSEVVFICRNEQEDQHNTTKLSNYQIIK